MNAGGFSTGGDAARQNKPDETDATSASRCAFHKSLARAAPCLQTGKQTHPGELTVKTHLCLLPFNFLPHTQTDAARPARFHGWMRIHSKKPPSSPTIHLCCTHTHTHTQAKLMTSILQAQTEAVVLCSKQFSVQQASEEEEREDRKVGEEPGRRRRRRRKNNLRERIGVFILS